MTNDYANAVVGEIERLRAENERLRAAVAKVVDSYGHTFDEDDLESLRATLSASERLADEARIEHTVTPEEEGR